MNATVPVTAKPPAPRQVRIVTPERAELCFEIAGIGPRMMALVIDLLIIIACTVALILIVVFSGGGTFAMAVFIVGWFLLRSFYFISLEFRWRGQTVGKKAMKLRIIARDGGPLTPGMILARNLAREVELFLPIQVMLAGRAVLGVDATFVTVAAVLWLITAFVIPIVHKQHARLGDLVAGTLVVVAPRSRLSADLAAAGARRAPSDSAPEFVFTREQLDVYGIFELQTLEEVLRMERSERKSDLLIAICEKVMRKIDWPEDRRDVLHPEAFLNAFYAAQRHRLEKELLFGRRKEKKSQ